jgi:hypothetical protein
VPLRQVAGYPLVDLAGLSDLPVPAYLSEYLAHHQDSRCHALEASDGE